MSAREPSGPVVDLDRAGKVYAAGELRTDVLHDVSLRVGAGELVVVFGVSGSGKTTLLNLVGGLDRCSSGRVVVAGVDLSLASPDALTAFRRDRVGFVFQFYNLLPTLTAAENVEAGLEVLPLRREELRRRSRTWLERVGLGGKADKFPAQLSGGEQQRVAVARALAKEPGLVLADEPTGNLDEGTAETVIGLIRRMNRETGTTFLLVTHNPRIAEVADRVVEIHGGRAAERARAPAAHRAARPVADARGDASPEVSGA